MILYIDENMSPYLAKGLHFLQMPMNKELTDPIEIRTLQDQYGKGCKDEDWIPIVGSENAFVITQDDLKRVKHQRELCAKYNMGIFYVKPPSNKGIRYWDMVSLIIKCWPEICKIMTKYPKPFTYKISPKGKIERID